MNLTKYRPNLSLGGFLFCKKMQKKRKAKIHSHKNNYSREKFYIKNR